ncbi:hypothetical protein CAPTEDRAFT_130678 [Capitella teleta]|uniref:3'-5' exoribonuclease 1 n=1 Tax=Capitella teleta TaxID=283909 RepID=R7U5Z2_CAPTE|nr:hypothetical protein CAPTEDRAFT_130678 [Capitella teleta]|eukprot:ELT98575.1 hypothetical protein CAPTEDRAFT_130678 [Capitella teleta]
MASKEENGKKYDHPVYKKISRLNGDINRMSRDELKERLESLHLNSRGVKEVLKKRLKAHYKRHRLQTEGLSTEDPQYYDFYLVVDFEATCEDSHTWPHEIIEFPIVVIDGKTHQVVDEFHSYVRPTINPVLTDFCISLTGISQDQVDSSPLFPEVLTSVESWLHRNKYCGKGVRSAFVTDGPWDMSRFMYLQCKHSNLAFPRWANTWVNIRKTYCNFYHFKRTSLRKMLENMGMSFEGRPHCGLDDTRNIARIAQRMLQDGSPLNVNERLFGPKLKSGESLEEVEIEVRGDGSSGLEKDLAALSVTAAASDPESDHEDLLSYYSLQKS